MSDPRPPRPTLTYRLLRGAIQALTRLLVTLDVQGMERIPPDGPLLLTANHTTALEGPILFGQIPRAPLAVLAKKEWQGTPAGMIIDVVHGIYVSRGEVDRHALRELLRWLKEGGAAGIAPEGTRSASGRLIEAKEGAAYLALQSGAQVVPIVVWGHQGALEVWMHLRRPRVFIRVGHPFTLARDSQTTRQQNLEAGTTQIMHAIARLLPAEYRGFYAGEVEGPPEW